jgi:RNA polymerase sigma-70 factor (ECF subfamily)
MRSTWLVTCAAMDASTTPNVIPPPDRLHARYARKIRRHIRSVLGPDDEHEDIAQDVLITIMRKIDTLRDPACLDGWVSQVTANTLKYVIRQRRLRRHASWEDLTEPHIPSVQVDVHARDLAARVLHVINTLPPNDRNLLTTYWFSAATAENIASRDGCSVITVRRKLSRARIRFEKLARRDPALAACFGEAGGPSQRSSRPSSTSHALVSHPVAAE